MELQDDVGLIFCPTKMSMISSANPIIVMLGGPHNWVHSRGTNGVYWAIVNILSCFVQGNIGEYSPMCGQDIHSSSIGTTCAAHL